MSTKLSNETNANTPVTTTNLQDMQTIDTQHSTETSNDSFENDNDDPTINFTNKNHSNVMSCHENSNNSDHLTAQRSSAEDEEASINLPSNTVTEMAHDTEMTSPDNSEPSCLSAPSDVWSDTDSVDDLIIDTDSEDQILM